MFLEIRDACTKSCQALRAVLSAMRGPPEPSRGCPPRQSLERLHTEFVDEEQKSPRRRGWLLAALLPIRNQPMRHAGRGREGSLRQTEKASPLVSTWGDAKCA